MPGEANQENDPHGAAFWLDFLAVKSGNHQWILDAFEKHAEQFPVAVFQGYPGMGYAYALACRAREDAEKDNVSAGVPGSHQSRRQLPSRLYLHTGELTDRTGPAVTMRSGKPCWRSRRSYCR